MIIRLLTITSLECYMSSLSPLNIELVAKGDNTNIVIDVVSQAEMDVIDLEKRTYTFNKFLSLVLTKPERYSNFVKQDGLIYLQQEDKVRLVIPDATTSGRRLCEVLVLQAHLILAHLGTSKHMHTAGSMCGGQK